MTNLSFFIRNLEAPWVAEIIAERFDNAADLLVGNSVVYGGAVRDALAGLSLLGDLDISVSAKDVGKLSGVFNKSVRWSRTHADGKEIKTPVLKLSPAINSRAQDSPAPDWQEVPRSASSRSAAKLFSFPPPKLNTGSSSPGKAGSGYSNYAPISSLTTYTTIGGVKVQIMVSKSPHSDDFENALFVPRNVDIRCCGVAMDRDGNVYEVVKDAYQDCKDKVLKINKLASTLDVSRMIDRIIKLEKRGWKNEIDIKKVEREVNKLMVKEKRIENSRKKKEIERHRREREEFEKKISAKYKGSTAPMGSLNANQRFNILRLSPDSYITNVSYEQLENIPIDDFISILQDIASEDNIVAQVHPFPDGLIIETLDAENSDTLMNATWDVVDHEHDHPEEQVAPEEQVSPSYQDDSANLYEPMETFDTAISEQTLVIDAPQMPISPNTKMTISYTHSHVPRPSFQAEATTLDMGIVSLLYEEENDDEGTIFIDLSAGESYKVKVGRLAGGHPGVIDTIIEIGLTHARACRAERAFNNLAAEAENRQKEKKPAIEIIYDDPYKQNVTTISAIMAEIEPVTTAERVRALNEKSEVLDAKLKALNAKKAKFEQMRTMYGAAKKERTMPSKFQKMIKKGV